MTSPARVRRGAWRWLPLVISLLALPAQALDTEKIFERYEDSVVQIRIVEAGSGAKRTIGTGFVVGAGGELATNYHVISDLVIEPVGDCRADGVFRDVSPDAVVVGTDIAGEQATPLLRHMRGLPSPQHHFADPAHCLRIAADHRDRPEVVQ